MNTSFLRCNFGGSRFDFLGQGIITLLSDLGTADASIAGVKAGLMSFVPDAVIVDISHRVATYDLRQAAYLLQGAYRHFAAGTVHIAMADVRAGALPRMLLALKEGHYFIAPDIGLLPLAFGGEPFETWLCREWPESFAFSEWVNEAGMATAAAWRGGRPPYPACELIAAPVIAQPIAVTDGVECNILCIDRFDNVVLDMTRKKFEEMIMGRLFRIKMMRLDDITRISNNYNDAPRGGALCLFNTGGNLEIAVNHGSAAALLGLSVEDAGNLRYRIIKIHIG